MGDSPVTEYVSCLHHEAEILEEPAESLVVGAPRPRRRHLVSLAARRDVSYLVSED